MTCIFSRVATNTRFEQTPPQPGSASAPASEAACGYPPTLFAYCCYGQAVNLPLLNRPARNAKLAAVPGAASCKASARSGPSLNCPPNGIVRALIRILQISLRWQEARAKSDKYHGVFVFLFPAGRALKQQKSSAWCFKLHPAAEGPKEMENGTSGKALCPLMESSKYILLPLTYSSVFVLGLLLKRAVLWLSCCRTMDWTCTTIYLDTRSFGELLCRLVRFLFYANLYGSTLLLTCTSVHRFLGVRYPIRSLPYRTPRPAAAGTAASWTLVFLQLLPTLSYAHAGVTNNHTVCYDVMSPENLSSYHPYSMRCPLSFPHRELVSSPSVGFTVGLDDLKGLLQPIRFRDHFSLLLSDEQKPHPACWRHQPHWQCRPSQVDLNHSPCVSAFCCLFTAISHRPQHLPLCSRVRVADCQPLQRWSLLYKIWRPPVSLSSCINPLLCFLSGQTNGARLASEPRPPKAGPLARPAVNAEGTDAAARLAPC
ncbi:hypothetical protein QYF61_019165 [Mycteria americana]|uniref:G-protein coupled receptors family 1 profile domain-containing protein n=1 Tax=Mycteria americana TaxID=33587 RepID=A0AAN7N1S2_MYCAM|nr:hypothetical protein QYF61_019165 [Mycteria americana]